METKEEIMKKYRASLDKIGSIEPTLSVKDGHAAVGIIALSAILSVLIDIRDILSDMKFTQEIK